VLELGRKGKFAAKSTGWDENQVFLEDDKLEVAVEKGTLVLPASRLDRGRLSGRYSTTSVPKSDAVTAPAVAPHARCDGATVAQQPRCDGATERFRRCGGDRQPRSAIACRSPSLKRISEVRGAPVSAGLSFARPMSPSFSPSVATIVHGNCLRDLNGPRTRVPRTDRHRLHSQPAGRGG